MNAGGEQALNMRIRLPGADENCSRSRFQDVYHDHAAAGINGMLSPSGSVYGNVQGGNIIRMKNLILTFVGRKIRSSIRTLRFNQRFPDRIAWGWKQAPRDLSSIGSALSASTRQRPCHRRY